ncbi:MAG: reverse transcriptase family protein [Oscillospiraceae bacterium]
MTPKFKKGSPAYPSNYRPISLTCTCCKILESLIANDLLDFLISHKLISSQQHGFLKKHSTCTNLLESLNDWTISLSNHNSVTICYIDFQRAFDVISHNKLLHKLAAYGISANLLFWIKSFLTDRFHCVRINSFLSSYLPVRSGVPQGSVLGPLLFNLFINDITDQFNTNVTTKLFADDVKMYTNLNFPLAVSNFQAHLNLIQDWATTWQLNISYNKCNITELGRHPSSAPYHLNNFTIKHISGGTDLGVHFESNLNFKIHIKEITTRALQRSALVRRCFLSRTTDNLIKAYITYIRPLVEYASVIWSPSHITLINAIEKVQKNFTKRLPGLKNYPYSERLNILKIQSLEHRRLLADLTFCYNIVHGLSAVTFDSMFKFRNNRALRGHSLSLEIPLTKNNLSKFFFSSRVVPPWNSLPDSLVLASNVKIFKYNLKKINLSKFLSFPSVFE